LILAWIAALAPAAAAPTAGPVVLAAASLQESLNAAADAWAARGHRRPVLSFAGSPALARQVLAGAPADLFISADAEWMDMVQKAGALVPGTRAPLVGNRLVLIAPAGSTVRFALAPGVPLARALGTGRLAMADPDSVPAGRYGRAALTALGLWPQVEGRIARADNVRAALALVERGETPLGIVYATDAMASGKVRVAGVFPARSHPPIRYPIARVAAGRDPEAEGFRRFLLSGSGRAVLRRFGFTAP
jgi:molybdate transport system substrate-binding protein